MRIAICMLAHKNLLQLDKLLKRLTEDFDVYLHLDEKWDVKIGHFKKLPPLEPKNLGIPALKHCEKL